MVRGLVDQQATAILLFAMPTAEVISAMARVKNPREIDSQGTAYGSLHDRFAEFCIGGRGKVTGADSPRVFRPLNSGADGLYLFSIRGHSVFRCHIPHQLPIAS